MGFYATEKCPTVEDLPPKNRVMGSRRSAATRARVPASEPVETASETTATVTITVSGLACWLSRDPIEEEGGLLLYGFVYNDPVDLVDPDGEIPLDTIWDIGNIIYDIAVGDSVSLAADTVALCVPYLPAGSTKLVKVAKAADVLSVANTAKKIEVSYEYYGVASGFVKHTLPKSAAKGKWWTATKGAASKFNPGWGDKEIKDAVGKALQDAKAKGKLKPGEIDGYIFDTGGVVGASNGKKTTKIKIHINADGKNLHAYPID